MAAKRSRKTRKTARKTRKIARKTRRKTRKTIRRKVVRKVKKRPARRKRSAQSSSVKHNTDIGTLALRPYLNAKRKSNQYEIKKYEQKDLARYKPPKSKPIRSSNIKRDTD